MSEIDYMRCGKKVKWPAALTELYDIISDALKDAGYEKEARQSITWVVIRALSFMAGGRQFYLPSAQALERGIRNVQIFRDFTGDNIDDLARKYRLGTVQIYSIIRKQREVARLDQEAISRN